MGELRSPLQIPWCPLLSLNTPIRVLNIQFLICSLIQFSLFRLPPMTVMFPLLSEIQPYSFWVFLFCNIYINSLLCLFFKTGFLSVSLPVLELTLQTRLSLNSRGPPTSVSQVPGLKACSTTAYLGLLSCFTSFGLCSVVWISWTLLALFTCK